MDYSFRNFEIGGEVNVLHGGREATLKSARPEHVCPFKATQREIP
jgi:hypothetical protein